MNSAQIPSFLGGKGQDMATNPSNPNLILSGPLVASGLKNTDKGNLLA